MSTSGAELVTVSASALSKFSKLRSEGTHYSSEDAVPAVAGADGVGQTSYCRNPPLERSRTNASYVRKLLEVKLHEFYLQNAEARAS